MTVGQSGEFGQDFARPSSVPLAAHGQFERGFAARPAPDSHPAKQSPVRRVEFAFFQLAQSPLPQHAQVVSSDGQMMHRLGAPEIVHAQPFDPKLIAQFLDAVFDVGLTVVSTPNIQGIGAPGQVGHQRLKAITWQVQQGSAARLRSLLQTLPQHDQAAARAD